MLRYFNLIFWDKVGLMKMKWSILEVWGCVIELNNCIVEHLIIEK